MKVKKIPALLISALIILASANTAFADYIYSPVTVTIPVQVEQAIDTATVVIEGEGVPTPAETEVKPDSEGKASFSMTYIEPGTYKYQVSQRQTGAGIIADDTVYEATVFISTVEETGELTSQVLVYMKSNDDKPNLLKFTNKPIVTKTPAPTPTEKAEKDNTTGTTGSKNSSNVSSTSSANPKSGNESDSEAKNMNNVQTGDTRNVILWVLLSGAAIAGLVGAFKKEAYGGREE